jgi:acetyltransferase
MLVLGVTQAVLEALFTPKSIAVVGASRTPGKVGYEILKHLKDGAFEGELVPVNPHADEILGLKCCHKISEYKGEIECGIVAVPTELVEGVLRNLVSFGVKAVIIVTTGFKEVGEEGAALQRKLTDICRERGVHLLGPNVVGLINPYHKMNASFALQMPGKGNISVLSQSGSLLAVFLDWATGNGIGLAKLISIGNKAGITEVELLQALTEDEHTRVIAGYIEDILDGNEFIRAAKAASSVKPVVLLKGGISEQGQKAAASHTGSLAGVDIAYGAAFKRAGIIRPETFEELLDFSMAFSMQPLPGENRVAIITNAGGPGIIAVDAVENRGMRLAAFDEGIKKKLREKLPAAVNVANPLNVLLTATSGRYAAAVDILQDDDSVDAILMLFAPQVLAQPVETVRAVARCMRGKKPILASFMGAHAVLPGRRELARHNIPNFPTPERAVAALGAMYEYSHWLRRPPRIVTRFPVNRRRAQRIINRHVRAAAFYAPEGIGGEQEREEVRSEELGVRSEGLSGIPESGNSSLLTPHSSLPNDPIRISIGEVEAKSILKAYDFTVPEGAVATSPEEAVETAEHIGYPVAMKIYSPDIIHKSDVGGVRTNIPNSEALLDAFDLMMLRIGRHIPQARLDGIYIEKMGKKGRDVILGMKRDPQFGPMLMFGLGGIFVEVMKDVTFHLAPITADEAMQMLRATRSYEILKGVRGQAAVDLPAIAGGLQRISQLVTDFPQITELDINPLIVGEAGAGAYVADANISLNI